MEGAELFAHDYVPDHEIVAVKPAILHPMFKISEEEKIIFYDTIVIKPIGMGASAGFSYQNDAKSGKGHVVNAGVLYILESGLMKVLSSSGTLLIEKNVGFDITEQDPTDGIQSMISSPNPEDMFVVFLTKNGRIIKYQL